MLKWKNETRKVKDLIPADYNPRDMTEKERQDLANSIEEFNEVEPVVVNTGKRKDVLIGGHQRVKHYADIGKETVDVRVPSRELSLEEEQRLNLRLNRNVGHFVGEKLKELDLTMLLEVGFDDDDLAMLWDDVDTVEDDFDVERAVKEIKVPRIKEGEIWQLGDHRLMCGDSTNPDDVSELMDVKADLIYCDPPYNIGLDYNKGIGGKGDYGGGYSSKKDSKKDEVYYEFIKHTVENAIQNSKKDFHIFYWSDERFINVIQNIYNTLGIDNRRVCLWIKNSFNVTPQVAFNKVYEPCVYGTRGKPKLNKNIRNLNEILNQEVGSGNQVIDEIMDIITIWLVKRDNTQQYEHPTQKPVSLNEKPIKRCTSPGDVMLDLFGGSGSSLIACEQLGRKARMMEIDPIFATVIVDRWEAFSSKKAKKI